MIYFCRVRCDALKIGYTVDQDLHRRMGQLSSRYGCQVELLAFCEGDRERERYFHRKFADHRLGRREHFRLAPELLGYINHPLLLELDGVEPVTPTNLDSMI